jgi:hypothetical protein
MDFIQGLPPGEDSIPISWWVENPKGVAERLNNAAIKLGFKAHFTVEDVKRFKE